LDHVTNSASLPNRDKFVSPLFPLDAALKSPQIVRNSMKMPDITIRATGKKRRFGPKNARAVA
jgi:hypothetical protein